MVESILEVNRVSSHDCCAQVFGDAARKHWGIENSVHWVLDIACREDESRIRKGFRVKILQQLATLL